MGVRHVGLPGSESVSVPQRGRKVSTVLGRQRSPSEVISALQEALGEDGDTIVACDLRGMGTSGAAVARMFTPVSDYLDHWPGAAVVVCSEDEALLTSLSQRTHRRLLARADSGTGISEMAHVLPPVQQARLRLPADPSAARQAREFATHALQGWEVADVVGKATLVVSELVTNSIRHAQTINELTLSLAQERLRIAVHDLAEASPKPTRHLDTDALDGRGLCLVEVMSRTWGVFPSTLPGKTVWAILDIAPSRAEQTPS
jgi:anti-sigma regulatory factor (Ser/Thr protein kinase)